ncbi:MAG: hypothetical protein IT434_08210 [Phycisphaerales bacterium]|jgi:hypothetical protein|nr:hypothetical protein [Phycisphaerales bacterium]
MNREPEPRSFLDNARSSLNLLAFVAGTLANSVEVILHRRRGKRAGGVFDMAAFVLIPFWGVFFPAQEQGPLLAFWLVYAIACARHSMHPADPSMHSRYSGRPILMRFFPRVKDEITFKASTEPALVFLAGFVTLLFNEPLGSYLMAAGLGLGFTVQLALKLQRARAEQLNDARLEQEHLIAEVRRLRNER